MIIGVRQVVTAVLHLCPNRFSGKRETIFIIFLQHGCRWGGMMGFQANIYLWRGRGLEITYFGRSRAVENVDTYNQCARGWHSLEVHYRRGPPTTMTLFPYLSCKCLVGLAAHLHFCHTVCLLLSLVAGVDLAFRPRCLRSHLQFDLSSSA